MPRVSQAVAKKTHQNIIDASFKILLLEGYEHLTYTHIAERSGGQKNTPKYCRCIV